MALTKLQQEKQGLRDYLIFEKLYAVVESGKRFEPEFLEAVDGLKHTRFTNGMSYEQLYEKRKNFGVEIPVVLEQRFGKSKSTSRR